MREKRLSTRLSDMRNSYNGKLQQIYVIEQLGIKLFCRNWIYAKNPRNRLFKDLNEV